MIEVFSYRFAAYFFGILWLITTLLLTNRIYQVGKKRLENQYQKRIIEGLTKDPEIEKLTEELMQ